MTPPPAVPADGHAELRLQLMDYDGVTPRDDGDFLGIASVGEIRALLTDRDALSARCAELERSVEAANDTAAQLSIDLSSANGHATELEEQNDEVLSRAEEILEFVQERTGTTWQCTNCDYITYHSSSNECADCGAPFPFENLLAFKLHAGLTDRPRLKAANERVTELEAKLAEAERERDKWLNMVVTELSKKQDEVVAAEHARERAEAALQVASMDFAYLLGTVESGMAGQINTAWLRKCLASIDDALAPARERPEASFVKMPKVLSHFLIVESDAGADMRSKIALWFDGVQLCERKEGDERYAAIERLKEMLNAALAQAGLAGKGDGK